MAPTVRWGARLMICRAGFMPPENWQKKIHPDEYRGLDFGLGGDETKNATRLFHSTPERRLVERLVGVLVSTWKSPQAVW